MLLSNVCLSVAYIGPKSRTERPRKTKIGTEIAHVTRDSDTTFEVKRSRSLSAALTRKAAAAVSMETYSAWESTATLRLLGAWVPGARRLGAHGGRSGVAAYCVATCTPCCECSVLHALFSVCNSLQACFIRSFTDVISCRLDRWLEPVVLLIMQGREKLSGALVALC